VFKFIGSKWAKFVEDILPRFDMQKKQNLKWLFFAIEKAILSGFDGKGVWDFN